MDPVEDVDITGEVNAASAAIVGAATVGTTLDVTGNASFDSIATFKTDYVVDVYANSDIGTGTASPKEVYSFTKADYKTAKVMAQASTR